MKLSSARTAAYDVLLKVETERAYSSTLLAEYEADLDPRDRGLCHELVLGVLRRKLLLDRYIDAFTRKKRLDIEIRLILQLGLFQIYCLDRVPDHAVVNEGVGLVVRAKKSSARGLVNAVLRAATREKPTLEFDSDLERIAVKTSHPEWLLRHWQDDLEIGSVEDLARSNNKTPPITFRRTLNGSSIALPDNISESERVKGCYIASSFEASLDNLADRGEIYFQDEASQMVAAAVQIRSGSSMFDVCAAPGGKTTYLAYQLREKPTSLVIAGDISERRVRLLRDTCLRQGADIVKIVRYDAAAALPFADDTFDTVLVDAPCTGTGTIRHNPEIRYFLEPDDFSRMRRTQIAILSNASKLVQSNGMLVYSTCSLETEENEDVCKAFLLSSPGWSISAPNVPPDFLTKDGYARTYPHRDGLDGFFIATFQRS